jgi:putative heme iron utilization protein
MKLTKNNLKAAFRETMHKAIAQALIDNPDATYRAIGQMFGYSDTPIRTIAKEIGVFHRDQTKLPISNKQIAKLLRSDPNLTFSSIVEKYRVSPTRVSKVAEECGIRVASRGRPLHATDAQIIKALKSEPSAAYTDIAQNLKVGLARVSKLARAHGLGRKMKPWGRKATNLKPVELNLSEVGK